MDQEKFNRIVDDMNEFSGVKDIYLLNSDGEVIFKSGILELTKEEGKKLLKAWKEKEPSLTYQNFRYAILKNDDIQLAAKNIVGDKGNIAGSITKEGDYLLIHTDSETEMILLEWSILVNKLAWS
jgi:regulatory protein YycH of two-component signal transduction system YycFG